MGGVNGWPQGDVEGAQAPDHYLAGIDNIIGDDGEHSLKEAAALPEGKLELL